MFRRRKGVSTILGAAIFVGILVLAFSSFQFFMKDLAALSDSYTKTAILDDDRRKESLIIERISLSELSSQSADISASSTAGATYYPLVNMNFTDNANGWIFSASLYNPEDPPTEPVVLDDNDDDDGDGSNNDDKEIDPANDNGVLADGGFTGGWSSAAIPSQSGAGSIFTHFSFVSENNNDEAGAMLKWTYKFSLDQDTADAIDEAIFSMGYYIPVTEEVKGPADNDKAVIFYTITDPGGTTHAIEIEEHKDEISWNRKEISTSDPDRLPNLTWTEGEYKLQLTVMVDLKTESPSNDKTAEFKIYFDDVGVQFNLENSSAQSTTVSSYDETYFGVSEQFNVGSASETIDSLDFSIQASSSVSAKQYVFLYDFAQSEWALLLSSSISSTTSNTELTKSSLDVPRFVAQIADDYTVDPGVTETAAVGDVWVRILVTATTTSTFTYSATISLDTEIIEDDKVSFVVSNVGGITAHIVRYWIVTGAETTSVDADTYLDPGKEVTLSEDITPTSGTVEIRIITERGSITTLTETV